VHADTVMTIKTHKAWTVTDITYIFKSRQV